MSYHYTTLADAKKNLNDRIVLQKEVEYAWIHLCGTFPPTIVPASHCGVFARQLASFRFEDAHFILMCEKAGLTPAWFPCSTDEFVSISPLKRSYIVPFCAKGYSKNGAPIVKRNRIVADANAANVCERKRLCDITTSEGAMLPQWHRQRLTKAYPPALILEEDCYKDIFSKLCVTDRYDLFLSLFVAHMVLFEDYHGGESGDELDGFTSRVFEPAFERVYKRFGVKPLIVPVSWKPEFAYYPDGELLNTWRFAPLVSVE